MGVSGDLADPDTFRPYLDMGYTLSLAGGDEWMLHEACTKAVGAFEGLRAC